MKSSFEDILIDPSHSLVYCWLRLENGDGIRIEASRKFVMNQWGVKWRVDGVLNDLAVKEAFLAHRREYVVAAMVALEKGQPNFVIADSPIPEAAQ